MTFSSSPTERSWPAAPEATATSRAAAGRARDAAYPIFAACVSGEPQPVASERQGADAPASGCEERVRERGDEGHWTDLARSAERAGAAVDDVHLYRRSLVH